VSRLQGFQSVSACSQKTAWILTLRERTHLVDEKTSHTQLGQANDGHVPTDDCGSADHHFVLTCLLETMFAMERLDTQTVMIRQMHIPLSVSTAGNVIHCHVIVVGTVNPQCWIRFRQSPEGLAQSVVLVWIQLHRDASLLVPGWNL
jgi:hypothetical protein